MRPLLHQGLRAGCLSAEGGGDRHHAPRVDPLGAAPMVALARLMERMG